MIFNSFQTPILITCRDRLEELRRPVSWLERAGYQRVVLVDNDSSYAPLLGYYDETPHQVIRLGRNLGHLAVWEGNVLDTLAHKGAFVVTDCDIVPDENAPYDAVDRFADLLFRHSDVDKVGFGLRIDDLPSTYKFRDDVIDWEGQFWEDEVEPGVFRAPLDTTFALYRPTAPQGTLRALRTGPPYVARHLPWYVDSDHLSEEERYYRDHMGAGISNWNLEQLPDELLAAIDGRRRQLVARQPAPAPPPRPEPTVTIHVPGVETAFRFVRTEQEGGFWDLFSVGRWHPETIAVIVSLLRPGSTFIDMGAWIGALSIIAAGHGARVVALEADPVALQAFRTNLALNPRVAQTISLVPKALAKRSGPASIASTRLGNGRSSISHGGAAAALVETIDARDWSSTPDFLSADLLKIDIEGAEFFVIPRLRKAFRSRRPVLLLSVNGYQFVERFPRLPGRARGATQHVVSLFGRIRILRGLRYYRNRWKWDASNSEWHPLTRGEKLRFLVSLAGAELLLSDGELAATTKPLESDST
jgi:FkbM family methyltransferase